MKKETVDELITNFTRCHHNIYIRYYYDKDTDTYTLQMGRKRRQDEPVLFGITEYVSNLVLDSGLMNSGTILCNVFYNMFIKLNDYGKLTVDGLEWYKIG